MQVLISAEGNHTGPDGARIPHAMVVDHHLLLLDLTNVPGTLVDPAITSVTWGLQMDGREMREGGAIYRRGNPGPQLFWNPDLLKPYLDAYAAKKSAIPA